MPLSEWLFNFKMVSPEYSEEGVIAVQAGLRLRQGVGTIHFERAAIDVMIDIMRMQFDRLLGDDSQGFSEDVQAVQHVLRGIYMKPPSLSSVAAFYLSRHGPRKDAIEILGKEPQSLEGATLYDLSTGYDNVLGAIVESNQDGLHIIDEIRSRKIRRTLEDEFKVMKSLLSTDPTGFQLVDWYAARMSKGLRTQPYQSQPLVSAGANLAREIYKKTYPKVEAILA